MRDSILYQRTRFSLLPAATLLAVACEEPGSPVHSAIGAVNLPQAGADAVGGLGTLGAGSATPGSDRQEFDFDVTADLSGGRLFYRDWAVVRPDGTVGTLTVDPADPSTAITAQRGTRERGGFPGNGRGAARIQPRRISLQW